MARELFPAAATDVTEVFTMPSSSPWPGLLRKLTDGGVQSVCSSVPEGYTEELP